MLPRSGALAERGGDFPRARACYVCARKRFIYIFSYYKGVPQAVPQAVPQCVPLAVSLPCRKAFATGRFAVSLAVPLHVSLAVPLAVSQNGGGGDRRQTAGARQAAQEAGPDGWRGRFGRVWQAARRRRQAGGGSGWRWLAVSER